jgi:hypothetical protein
VGRGETLAVRRGCGVQNEAVRGARIFVLLQAHRVWRVLALVGARIAMPRGAG